MRLIVVLKQFEILAEAIPFAILFKHDLVYHSLFALPLQLQLAFQLFLLP